jgi:hypothetical protein
LNTGPSVDQRCGNSSRGGLGNPSSQKGGLFFVTGTDTYMNVAAGFDTGLSFFYSAARLSATVGVFDGLSGTGNLLAALTLPQTGTACDLQVYFAGFCPFQSIDLPFNGIAKSVLFSAPPTQIVIDDVIFGSEIPDPPSAPEPSTLSLIALGVAGVAAKAFRRAKK